MKGPAISLGVLLCMVTAASSCGHGQRPVASDERRTSRSSASDVRDLVLLTEQITGFATRLAALPAAEYPKLSDAAFVRAARWNEVEPLLDRQTALAGRIERAMALMDAMNLVGRAYSDRDLALVAADPAHAGDSSEAVDYVIGLLHVFAVLVPILADEFMPTLDVEDPTYATRIAGYAKMQDGLFMMLRGALITLQARRADLSSRRQLAAALRQHGKVFARVAKPEHTQQLVAWTAEVAAKENDKPIRDALEALRGDLK